jgi:hypothetical protein
MAASDDNKRQHAVDDIENWNLDRSVAVPTKVTGIMGKTSASEWGYMQLENSRILISGSLAAAASAPLSADSSTVSAIQGDAGKLRISAIGVSVSTSPLSADSSSISAKSNDAGTMLVSAIQGDAAKLRISAIGVSVSTSPLSADSSSISAKQSDAANLNVSAKSNDAGTFLVSAAQKGTWTVDSGSVSAKSDSAGQLRISSFSNDAALMRVSAIGVSVTTSPLSADSSSISAIQEDAGKLKTSATITNSSLAVTQSGTWAISALAKEGTAFIGNVSARNTDAANFYTSGRSDDAALFRVSALGVTLATAQTLSATLKEGTAFVGSVSANQAGTWAISALAKEGTAFIGSVSANQAGTWAISALAKEGTSFIGNVSAKNTDGANFHVSAKSDSAGQLRVSAFSDDAANFDISAKSDSANLLRTSAFLGVDTTGALSIGRLSNLSSSGNIKAAAGVIYGYYAYNTDTKYAYINMTSTSGAINVGTDAVVLKIALPPSAAAHVEYPRGLKGFTAGIGAYATSAIADSATTPVPTSAVGINVFYN